MSKSINTQAVGVIADIAGTTLTVQDIEFLQQPELSGLIFFARNYQSPEQLKTLSANIARLRPDLLLCVDQEGGRVQRFREGFTRLPAMLKLAEYYAGDAESALNLAQDIGYLLACELLSCGVHLSFTPVLDIERGISQVIGDRALGKDAETVLALARRLIDGLQEQGLYAVGKHFPGHGAIAADSHLALPVDERSLDELSYDMQPFAALIQERKLLGIMPAHVLYPQVDAEHNAGFSPRWLKQILRQQLGFSGVIFSDDLSMQGAACVGDYSARTLAAVQAGANALLVCNNRDAAWDVIKTLRAEQKALVHLDLSEFIPPDRAVDEVRLAQIRARLLQL